MEAQSDSGFQILDHGLLECKSKIGNPKSRIE
jgi:hypothetical protein